MFNRRSIYSFYDLSYVDIMTFSYKNTDNIMKYNVPQENLSRKIYHVQSDAECVKGYKLAVEKGF